jgi:hypothetical protein
VIPMLKQNNYVSTLQMIDANRASDLAEGFIAYTKSHGSPGDSQAPMSPSVYNYMPFVRLLVELTPKISEIAGEQVLPTYSYARVYSHGEVLHRHRDRPACEVSVTLNLKKDAPWKIFFQRPDMVEVGVDMNPGDGVVYQGCVADHWRDAFEGQEYVQVFLHYVRALGQYQWAYFDKKQAA